MARNLAAAGFEVRAWNRTTEKARALEGERLHACERIEEAIRGADAVLTVLTDGDAVVQAVGGALEEFGDALWIQASTVGVNAFERLAASAEEHGITLVDAPVLGTKQPAERGELVVLASGRAAARDRCKPIFDAIGSKTIWLGEAGAGTRTKLVVNAWLAGLVASLAETIVLARGLDVDPARFLEIIDGSAIGVPYAQVKGRAMIEQSFPTNFALSLARKDVDLVLEAAQRVGVQPQIARAVAAQFDRAIEQGHGEEDFAAAYYGAL
jgi:3-hydroxyisobutyrate dehydrogenase